ncbi:MAG: PAS domain S-box protein [Methanoregulaceae archaeon]|nr:PAS domain S-box protein [Methanoregulaceae archaeon]
MTKTRPKSDSEKKRVAVKKVPPESEPGTHYQDTKVPVVETDAQEESEQFLKESRKIVKIGGWKANPSTNFLQWTDGIYDIIEAPLHYQPGFSEGLHCFSIEDQPLVRDSIETCLATGKPFILEVMITTGSGKKVWTELRGLRVVTEPARSYVFGTFQDITECRHIENALRRESEKSALLAESARLLIHAEDPKQVLQTVGDRLMKYLCCDTFFNYLTDESGCRMKLNASSGIQPHDTHRIEYLDPGDALCSHVIRKKKRMGTFDLIKIQNKSTCQIYPPGINGWIYSPIIYQGCILGMFFFGNRVQAPFSDDELELVQTATDLVATAMARKNAEREAAKSASLLKAALDSTTDGILVIDTSGKITGYNKTFCRIWGIPPHLLDAAEDKTALAYMTPLITDPGKFVSLLNEYYSHPARESFDTVRLNDGRLFERYSKPQKIGDTIVGRVWSYRDITERKQAEEAFQETLQRFYNILAEVRYGILLVTPDSRIEFANHAFCEMFNVPESPDDLKNLSAGEMIAKIRHIYQNPDAAVDRIGEIVRLGKEIKGEEVGIQGGRTFLRDFIPLYINEKQFGRLWSHIDITERKTAEEELQKSEARYHLLADNTTDVIWTLNFDGNFTYVSPSVFQLMGYTPEEAKQLPLSKVVSKGSLTLITEKMQHKLDDVVSGSPLTPDTIEIEQLCRDGSTVWVEAVYRLLVDENGKPTEFMGVSRNISKRKRAEAALQESLEKFRIIATNTPDHILLLDKDLRYSQVINPPFRLAEQDMIGKNDYDILSFEDADTLMKIKKQAIESGNAVHLEIPIPNASGELHFFSGSFVPKRNGIGEIDGLIGYFSNVTETKQANEKIVAALVEKETLIREIHHRVKNNLQIISGLLYMTRMRTKDPETTSILTDMMMKIKTMAQIHTRLYESKQFDRIDMSGYFQDQVTDLSTIYGRSGSDITCTVKAKDLFLPVDQAIPCALVVNEVLSNAFKHAFRGRLQGTIVVSAHQDNGNIRISIEDDGIGIPREMDIYQTTSLGLKLIRNLVGQLQGTLSIESSDRGSCIRFDFPLKTMG